MTLHQWRLIAFYAVGALFVVLTAAVVTKTHAERDAAKAAQTLDSVTTSLHDAQALARAGLTQSLAYKQRIDSLWTVIRAVQYAPPARQRTPFAVIDTADVHAVTVALVTVTAERDTALADLSVTRGQIEQLRVAADDLATASHEQAVTDSVRYATLAAKVDTAARGVQVAHDLVKPHWYTRLGRGIVATVKTGGLIALGVMIGKHT
jgi:hypothetical protein